jgi:hypothetical protein
MKINFSQIYEGWKNNLFPADDMKEHIRQVSQERMAICDACEWCSENKPKKPRRFDKHCTHCGCVLSAKTKCLSCACPIEKWVAEMESKDDENQLIQTIYGTEGSKNREDSTGQAN